MSLVSQGVRKADHLLVHSNGVNSKLPGAYFNAQDPSKQGGAEFRKREQIYHRTVACMSVNGCTNREIANTLGVGHDTVSQILRQPYAQAVMIEMQREAGVDELKSLIREGAQAIVRVAERAKNPTIEVAVRQRDDHCLVQGMIKSLKPADNNKPFIQLTDSELMEIVMKVSAMEVQSRVETLEEQVPADIPKPNPDATPPAIKELQALFV